MLNLKCGTREKQINASGCTLRQRHCPRKHSEKKKNTSSLPSEIKNISLNDSEASRGLNLRAQGHTVANHEPEEEAGQARRREKTLANVTQSVFTCGLKAPKKLKECV